MRQSEIEQERTIARERERVYACACVCVRACMRVFDRGSRDGEGGREGFQLFNY